MKEYEGELPDIQFFYQNGMPLRVVTCLEENWFAIQDVFNHIGSPVNEQGAASLLKAMGVACRVIPCRDGATQCALLCIAESGLMRVFDKMERFETKLNQTV
jgi:hypothetical protein